MMNDAIENLAANPEVVEAGLGEHAMLGCTYNYSYSDYSTYDLCYGSLCQYDGQCNTGCCWGSYSYSTGSCGYASLCNAYDDLGSTLAWLWWTIASTVFLCIIGCVICCVCMAKRRRREAELLTAMHHDAVAHSNNNAPTVVFQQPMQQPGMQQQYQQQPMMQ